MNTGDLDLRPLALGSLPKGDGRGHAVIVYLFLWSVVSNRRREVWVSNGTIARRCGIGESEVVRALDYLSAAGRIRVQACVRPERTHHGRSIFLIPAQPCGPIRVHFPPSKWVAAAWTLARRSRAGGKPDAEPRPCALVAIAVAAWVLAASEAGGPLTQDWVLRSPLAALRTMVAAPHGGGFNGRLAELERASVASRVGAQWRHGILIRHDLTPALELAGVEARKVIAGQVMAALRGIASRFRASVVWPSLASLARATGLDVDAVRDGLRQLESDGEIRRVRRAYERDGATVFRWETEIVALQVADIERLLYG